jgi:hypothetical protein
MRRMIMRRPSPAMIVAVVALIAALGGTALAGSGFLTKKKFNKFKTQVVKGPLQYVTTTASVPTAGMGNSYVAVAATCPAGTKVTGGGVKIPDPGNSGSAYVDDSYATTTGWAGHVSNYSASGTTATTVAICALVNSSSGAPPGS